MKKITSKKSIKNKNRKNHKKRLDAGRISCYTLSRIKKLIEKEKSKSKNKVKYNLLKVLLRNDKTKRQEKKRHLKKYAYRLE